MPEHFDVIIIGTGAGGGTLAHTLAPSGKRILLLERGNFLPREMANWDPDPVFVDGRYISPDTWYDADGTAFQPQVHYFVGGATKMYGAALYRLRPQDFGELQARRRPVAGLAGVVRRLRALLHEGRVALPGARQPRRRPDRGALEQAVPVAGGVARAAHPAARRRPRNAAGTTRSTRRAGSCSTRPTAARSTCIRCTWCDGYPVPRPRQVRRRDHRGPTGARVAERDAARRRRGDAARDRRVRPLDHQRRRRARRERRAVQRRRRRGVGRRREQRQDPPALGERPASERPRERLRPGRPELHVPQQQGRRRAVEGAQRDGLPEDARRSTTSTSAPTATTGRSATSRWSASRTRRR